MPTGDPQRWLIDMDGVLYAGDAPLPGVQAFFRWLEDGGHAYALVTNNAWRTVEELASKLRGLGLEVPPERIVTSPIATVQWLRERAPEGARVQAVGGPGLWRALYGPGSPFVPDWDRPDWLVVGLDMDVTYRKLSEACRAVQQGARFVATNPDTTLPSERGLVPGAGALQAVITLVTGVEPVVIGKPETAILEMALRAMPPEGEVVVLGDRLDTDILAGNRLGVRTALVLSGVSTAREAEESEIRPTHVFEDLPDLMRRWGSE